jgi:hypothetical protein
MRVRGRCRGCDDPAVLGPGDGGAPATTRRDGGAPATTRRDGGAPATTTGAPADAPPAARPWRGFAVGALTNLANPKLAVFMIAFYPQFVPADRPLLATTAALAALQVAIETLLYLGLAAGVGRARVWWLLLTASYGQPLRWSAGSVTQTSCPVPPLTLSLPATSSLESR